MAAEEALHPLITDDEFRRLGELYRLSPRERELLGLMLGGAVDNAELARRMHLSINTVKALVHMVFVKMRCSDKTNVVLACLRQTLYWRSEAELRSRIE